MSILENFFKAEKPKDYKILNLPKCDVVLNLNATFSDNEDIASALESSETNTEEAIDKLSELKDPFGNPKFFIKYKGTSQDHVDYILGRTKRDTLNPYLSREINKKGRYAFAGVLNEITMSKTVKELVATTEFQELAKKYKFSSFNFAEPLAAVVDKTADQKYVIYNWMRESNISDSDYSNLTNLAQELKRLFVKNGITPGDLNPSQFMIIGEGDHRMLVLIDIEAYTKISKPQAVKEFTDSPKI